MILAKVELYIQHCLLCHYLQASNQWNSSKRPSLTTLYLKQHQPPKTTFCRLTLLIFFLLHLKTLNIYMFIYHPSSGPTSPPDGQREALWKPGFCLITTKSQAPSENAWQIICIQNTLADMTGYMKLESHW